MAMRTGRSARGGLPSIEVLSIDEMPVGVAAAQPAPEALPRPPYAKGSPEARKAGRRGGESRKGQTALASGIGLAKAFSDPSFERYRSAAVNFARLHVSRLAQTVGGGECGPAPASTVWSAGLQLAASRWAFEVKGDVALGSRLANDSRQNLLAAHELCAREAQARKASGAYNPHAALAAALAGDDARSTSGHAERPAPRLSVAASEPTDAPERRTASATDNDEPKE